MQHALADTPSAGEAPVVLDITTSGSGRSHGSAASIAPSSPSHAGPRQMPAKATTGDAPVTLEVKSPKRECTRMSTATKATAWAPQATDLMQAEQADRDTAAGYRQDGWMPIWSTRGRDFSMYGAGIHLQFSLGLGLSRVIWFCAVLSVPFVAINIGGRNMEDGGHVPAALEGTHLEYVSWSSVANMGREQDVNGVLAPRAVSFVDAIGWGPYLAEDVGLGVSIVDAACVFVVFAVALWYELRAIPSASEDHRYTEAFSVFVDKLPRRLPGRQHARYGELLERHFEQILRGEVDPEDSRKVATGRKVISKADPGDPSRPRERWFGSKVCPYRYNARDGKGRHLGTIVRGGDGRLQVEWRAERGADGKHPKPMTTEFQPAELLDQPMVKRIEYQVQRGEFVPEHKMVHEVTLVRDFGGRLGALRAEAEQTRAAWSKADALAEVQPEEAAEARSKLEQDARERGQGASQAREELERALAEKDAAGLRRVHRDVGLPLEDRDVVGAYVIFSRRKNRNFVFDEYRFSRTWLRFSQRRDLQFGGCKIRANEATDPSEVFWEHMDFSLGARAFRTALVALVTLALVCFSVGFFASAKHAANVAQAYGGTESCSATQVVNPFNVQCLTGTECECYNAGLLSVINNQPAGIKDCCGDWLNAQYRATSAMVLASLAPVALNFVIAYAINFLANFTKSHTITSTNQGIVLMTTAMQLVNIVISVVLVNADFGPGWREWVDDAFGSWGLGSGNFPLGCGSFSALSPEWYAEVGATITFSLAASAITIPIAMPVSYFIHLAFKRAFAGRASSSEQLRALFIRPTYNLALISAQDAVMVMACIMFSAGLPILWAVLAVYLTLSYLAKKYTFLRGSREPPHFSHHLSRMMARYTQAAVVFHCAFAVWVFGEPESLPSKVVDRGLDMDGFHGSLSRLDYQNTHAAFLVLVLALLVAALRVVAFVLGSVGTAMAMAAARVFVGVAHSQSKSAVRPCSERCAGAGCTARAARACAAARAAGLWLGSCIADFKKAVEDSVLQDSFADGPREHFKKNRIPWSYDLGSSEEYSGVFGQRASGASSCDGSAQSTAEGSGHSALEAV